jgi:rfaE bifunctional protein nucleotidyltransferase chain/domain
LKLHVGSRNYKPDGYVTVDIDPANAPDIVADITDMAVVADASCDEVVAGHVLEHIEWPNSFGAIAEFARVLKPGGVVKIAVPDMASLLRMLLSGESAFHVMGLVYGLGGRVNTFERHRYGFTPGMLADILETLGFGEFDWWNSSLADAPNGWAPRGLDERIGMSLNMQAVKIAAPMVDPKGDDFGLNAGADLITPNARELARATRLPTTTEAEVVAAARAVMAATGIPAVLCTRVEKGMMLVTADGGGTSVPAQAREVFDVSGAGDTVIAALAMSLAAGHRLPEATRIANAAAGIAVGKLGTATVAAEELAHALRALGQGGLAEQAALDTAAAQRLVRDWRDHGLRIGFTNGCFDILHAGHVALLAAARRRCDRLIVALNTDASVARLKGPSRPVNTLADRAAVIAALSMVDAVVAFAGDTPFELIRALVPDVLVKGADYAVDQVVGADIVQAAGGEVALIALAPGRSTTAMLARAAAMGVPIAANGGGRSAAG